MKLQSDFSNYATKSNLKEATVIDTSEFAKKTDLTILKSNIDDLNINKLKAVPVDLRKLSNTVKSDDVKQTVHDELVNQLTLMLLKL